MHHVLRDVKRDENTEDQRGDIHCSVIEHTDPEVRAVACSQAPKERPARQVREVVAHVQPGEVRVVLAWVLDQAQEDQEEHDRAAVVEQRLALHKHGEPRGRAQLFQHRNDSHRICPR